MEFQGPDEVVTGAHTSKKKMDLDKNESRR